MMLDEALSEVSDARKRLAQITERISVVARYQEGERPAESATDLLAEARSLLARIETLTRQINLTNAVTPVPDVAPTLTAALATREHMGALNKLLSEAASTAAGTGRSRGFMRQLRSELAERTDLNVPLLRNEAASAAKARRLMDLAIQRAGMTTELAEE
jgi:hypothetical protein